MLLIFTLQFLLYYFTHLVVAIKLLKKAFQFMIIVRKAQVEAELPENHQHVTHI